MSWQPYNATNEPGTCLWCGRDLRRKADTQWEKVRREPNERVKCSGEYGCGKTFKVSELQISTHDMAHCPDCEAYIEGGIYRRRIVSRTVTEKAGDYADDCFCGLRCGYRFGLQWALLGKRFEPAGGEDRYGEGT